MNKSLYFISLVLFEGQITFLLRKKKAEGRKTLKQQRDTFLSGEGGGEPGVCDTIPEGQLNFLAMQ